MKPSHRWPHLFLAALCLALLVTTGALAQEPTPEPSTPPDVRGVEDRVREVEQLLETLRTTLEAKTDAPETEIAREADRQEIERLEELLRTLEERRQTENQTLQLEQEREELEASETNEPVGDGPPFTLAELDAILDQQSALIARQQLLEQSIREQEEGQEDVESLVEHHQRELRQLQEAPQTSEDRFNFPQRLRLANLEVRIAQETLDRYRLELSNDRAELELVQLRSQRLAELADRVEAQLRISEAQKQSAQTAIDAREKSLNRSLEEAQARVEAAKARWDQQQREGDDAETQQARAVWKLARDRQDLLAERLQLLEASRTALGIRYDLRLGHLESRDDLTVTRDQLEILLAKIDRWRRDRQSQIQQKQARISELEAELQVVGTSAPLEREDRELAGRVQELEQHLEDLHRVRLHVERPLGRIEQTLGTVSPMERLTLFWDGLTTVWNYELLEVENNPITAGKILLALLLLILGAWASRYLSQLFARRVLERFRLDEGVVAALQKFTFYLLFLAFFLWALRLVNIPLTVFTFLGGAVAIGVGFGSQNIVNNFMSGLILMAERPIKVGDLVEMDGTAGRVEYIGARSTRIHLGDNSHIIVPNSDLLESRVMNWTLANNLLRTAVEVGVAYGSDLESVREATEAALEGCERIQESPKPEILFLDFAADALLFRVLFWVRVSQPLDLERARSELRFQIDDRYREAGISIAFPQRDVHFDQPLEIHLRREGRAVETREEIGSERVPPGSDG